MAVGEYVDLTSQMAISVETNEAVVSCLCQRHLLLQASQYAPEVSKKIYI